MVGLHTFLKASNLSAIIRHKQHLFESIKRYRNACIKTTLKGAFKREIRLKNTELMITIKHLKKTITHSSRL